MQYLGKICLFTSVLETNTFSPTGNYQQAGLIIYTDDNNYVSLARKYGNGNKFSMVKEPGGTATEQMVTDTVTVTATIYLKLVKSGTTYTGYWSSDNATWTQVYQFTGVSLTSPKIGLFASNGSGTTNINADFDYFNVN